MAVVDDNFDDLSELESSEDDLTETFTKAAIHLQTILSKVDKATLLTLYGYYKQATEGPCKTSKPSWFDVKAKSKWESWTSLGDMAKNEAKKFYIDKITEIDPEFMNPEKTSSKTGWVSVSTHYNADGQKKSETLADFITEGNIDKVELMLKSMDPQEINKLDNQGLGPIHWAADRGLVDILQLLLKYKADVNLEDSEKQTALHYAASCGHYSCVDFLLKNGIDRYKQDEDGLSALSVATDEHIKALLLHPENVSS